MVESDLAAQKVKLGTPKDTITIAKEKALVFSRDLTSNDSRLNDPKVYNKLGVFVGSCGDYIFHQRLAIEEITTEPLTIISEHAQPASAREHATWFLESILSGEAESSREAIFSHEGQGYPHGQVLEELEKLSRERGLGEVSAVAVCATWAELREFAENQLHYKPEVLFLKTQEEEMAPKANEIKIGDDLPETYRSVLEKLNGVAPENFIQQATQLAYYFWSLDTETELIDKDGKSMSEEVDRVAEMITNLPSVNLVYLHFRNDERIRERNKQGQGRTGGEVTYRPGNFLSPAECLPRWILSRKQDVSDGVTGEGIPMAAEFYGKWTEEHGEKSERGDDNHYYFYPDEICPPHGKSVADIFKGYIEKDATEEDMRRVFEELSEKKLHPHSSKLFEKDRMVLYWDSNLSDELSIQIMDVFNKHNVHIRGFGQDRSQFNVDRNGDWSHEIRASSDQVRGEGYGVDLGNERYDVGRFFELCLKQAFDDCRNPLDHYRISFVPVINANVTIRRMDELQHELDLVQQSGYGVAYYTKDVPSVFN